MNDVTLKAYATYLAAKTSLRDRMAEEDGQTAAEYLGIVVVIALIIGAIYTSDIDSQIADGLTSLVSNILGGGGGGGGGS